MGARSSGNRLSSRRFFGFKAVGARAGHSGKPQGAGLSRPGSERAGREEANFLFPKGEFFHGELHKGLAIGQAEKLATRIQASLGLQQRNFPVPAALEGALEAFLTNAEAEYGKGKAAGKVTKARVPHRHHRGEILSIFRSKSRDPPGRKAERKAKELRRPRYGGQNFSS